MLEQNSQYSRVNSVDKISFFIIQKSLKNAPIKQWYCADDLSTFEDQK